MGMICDYAYEVIHKRYGGDLKTKGFMRAMLDLCTSVDGDPKEKASVWQDLLRIRMNPDAWKILPDSHKVRVIEIEDTNPLSESKLERLNELNDTLATPWQLEVILVNRYGSVIHKIDFDALDTVDMYGGRFECLK